MSQLKSEADQNIEIVSKEEPISSYASEPNEVELKRGKMKISTVSPSTEDKKLKKSDEQNNYQFPSNRNALDQTEMQKPSPFTITTEVGNNHAQLNPNDNQKQDNQFINHNVNTHSCLTFFHRCLSNRVKIIFNIISFIISFFVFLLSFVEIFKQYELMNTIYFFSIEIVITLISIFFDMVMLTTPKKSKAHILYVISLISIFVFCINQIITIVHNKYTVPYLIINCVYCLVLMTTLLISLCEINRTIKTQKNVMQNIEEIINFTEINEEKKNNQPNTFSIIDDGTNLRHKKSAFNLIEEENKTAKKAV